MEVAGYHSAVTMPAFFPWLMLAIAIVLGLNAWRGFATGYVGYRFGGARRADSPILFWVGMAVSILGAVYMAVIAALCFVRSA